MDAKGKIIVIGDSHTRTFSYNNNFLPFFVGEGRTHNFINGKGLANVKHKALSIIDNLENVESIIFVFGCPDTRYFLGKGWKPWKAKPINNWRILKERLKFFIRRKANIRNSFKRYCQFIVALQARTDARLFILNITPSKRKDQNKLVNYFNKLLSEFCRENRLEFININHVVYNADKKSIKNEYYGDPVHLNRKLQLIVENWLIDKSVIRTPFYDSKIMMDTEELRLRFKYNDKFGCYTV